MDIGSLRIENGCILVLEDAKYKHAVRFRAEVLKEGRLVLAKLADPYARLHLLDRSEGVLCKAVHSPNRNCILTLRCTPTGHHMLTTVPASNKASCLRMLQDGSLCSHSVDINNANPDLEDLFTVTASRSEGSVESMRCLSLRKSQLRDFAVHGFLQLAGVVSADKLTACSRLLLQQAGRVGGLVAGGVQGAEFGKLPGSFSQHAVVREVFSAEVRAVVQGLLGGPIEQEANLSAQIALRHPQDLGPAAVRWDEWHTDGYRQGIPHPFSLLVGIALSPVDGPLQGNLTVFPGSHFPLHACRLSEDGGFDTARLIHAIATQEVYSDLRCAGPGFVAQRCEGLPPRPALPFLGNPLQLMAQPGDIVLLHADLAHCGALNLSPRVRQMVFFRIRRAAAESWEEVAAAQAEDMWVDLIGVRQQLGSELQELERIYKPRDGIVE